MSYILDALKKSERQRQAIQPGTVTDRILVEPPQTQQRPKKWMIILGIANLCALVMLLWFFNKKPSPNTQSEAVNVSAPDKQNVVVETAMNNVPLAQPIRQNTNVNEPSAVAEANPQEPSIADMMAENNPATNVEQRPNIANTEKKNALVKKPPVAKSMRNRPQPDDMIASVEPPAPRYSRRAEIEDDSADIQPERPKMTINVFSYAPRPEDRFVMINMTKYKVGQLINNGIKLKAINSDHIVLQQGGTTFKVDRP